MSNIARRSFDHENRKYLYGAAVVIVVVVISIFAATHVSSKIPPLTTVFPMDNNRFTISSGAKTGPMLQEGYLIPFFPMPGDTQTLSLKVSDTQPVTSVTVTIVMDKTVATYPLRLSEGDTLHGLWQGSWGVSDTHDNVYNIIMYAADKTSSSSVQITEK
jgi:hypothetical protein